MGQNLAFNHAYKVLVRGLYFIQLYKLKYHCGAKHLKIEFFMHVMSNMPCSYIRFNYKYYHESDFNSLDDFMFPFAAFIAVQV